MKCEIKTKKKFFEKNAFGNVICGLLAILPVCVKQYSSSLFLTWPNITQYCMQYGNELGRKQVRLSMQNTHRGPLGYLMWVHGF